MFLQCVLEEEQKYLKLLELLGLHQESGAVLVFVDKQEHADELTKRLMDSGYPCMPLHGGIDQYDRDSTISDFKNGGCRLLVSTLTTTSATSNDYIQCTSTVHVHVHVHVCTCVPITLYVLSDSVYCRIKT